MSVTRTSVVDKFDEVIGVSINQIRFKFFADDMILFSNNCWINFMHSHLNGGLK